MHRFIAEQVGRATAVNPFTNIVGVGRSLLGLSTMLTLVATPTSTLFHPAAGVVEIPHCEGVAGAGIYCLAGSSNLEVARWTSVLALVVVVIGWRPRITAIPHWWVTFSLMANAVLIDGGDQVAGVLALLLVPVALSDGRVWQWQRSQEAKRRCAELQRWTAYVALVLIKVQVATIYFHSGVAKLGVREWVDGTALYYFVTDPTFGARGILRDALGPPLRNGVVVSLLTWAPIALELAIAIAILTGRPSRTWMFCIGVVFHAAIALVMGLVSFSTAMFGALALSLQPRWSVLSPPSNAEVDATSEHRPTDEVHPAVGVGISTVS